jgi:hypothetical protein
MGFKLAGQKNLHADAHSVNWLAAQGQNGLQVAASHGAPVTLNNTTKISIPQQWS